MNEKRDELEEVVRSGLDEEDIFILKRCLRMIERLDEELGELDARISMLIRDCEEDVKRISRVPGVGEVSAPAILAEVGDYKRFENGKKIASRAGLCPSVPQTGDKNLTGKIKHGSKILRIMVQVAHAASRARDSRFRRFHLRVAARRGKKKAIVALARKILCIIHHLLVNGEDYVEGCFEKAALVKV